MKPTLYCTQREMNAILSAVLEVGWSGLTDRERELASAYDEGRLHFIAASSLDRGLVAFGLQRSV